MIVRSDLLALDEGKLAALANKGLVKRAQKDLEAGQVPVITVEDDGTLVATLGGVVTRLPRGASLAEAPCSCGALKACRHRVLAVLAYRALADGAPAPEASSLELPSFDDDALAAYLGARVLDQARRARARGYVADVVRGEVPLVELSTCTVRFLVPSDLAFTRCDCQLGQRCEHVALAVWALREAIGRGEVDRVTIEVGEAAAARIDALGAALELVRELLLDGVEGSGAALAARFALAVKPLEDEQLRWPITICEELEEALASYAARRASYRPELVGSLATELFARARAGRGEGEVPARAVLGAGEPKKTLLEHVRLVSLGARLAREVLEPGKARIEAHVHLADPDTLTVLVYRRAWDVDEQATAAAIAGRTAVAGATLATLARGQVVTRSAERAANRAVTIGASRVARTTVTPSSGRWDFAEPLGYARYDALAQRMRERPPAFVRPRVLAERVHVLRIASVGALAYSAGEQVLRALVFDDEGAAILLALEHSAVAPGAIDALAHALGGTWGTPALVSGEVRLEGATLVMRPLSVVVPDRVVALDLESADPAVLPRGGAPQASDPFVTVLAEARDQLDAGAHRGLLHVSEGWREQIARVERSASELGLRTCAARLAAVRSALASRASGEATRAIADAWLEASLRIRVALAS